MSRSTTLVLATLAVLALLFSAYLFLAPQPNVSYQSSALNPSTRRSTTGPTGSLGQGEGAWVKQFDIHTGQLSSQFRGQEYQRQPDNSVLVTKPQAEFYLSDGQVLRIQGRTGVVAIPEALKPGKDQYFNGPSHPPTRGDLKSVRIQLFKDAASATPTLTCVMDNATFDNETFRIFTQDAVIDGHPVPADQIPVTLRGTDYDFDGRGLTIRLNERDRRLEYLEVTHGNRLTIKNPSKLTEQLPPPGPTASATPSPLPVGWALPTSSPPLPPLPYQLAAADPAASLPPLPTRPTTKQTRKGASPPTTHATGPSIYRATFQDNVRVTQADQDLATGNQLQIDFLFDNGPSATTKKSPTAKPSTKTTAAAPTPTPAAPVARTASASIPAAQATSAPTATQPAPQPPVTIYWTGKLTLHPTPPPSQDPPTAKNSIVHLTGSPLHVRQGPSTITGSSLTYRTGTQHLSLRGTDQYPLALSDGKGAVVHGTSIDYLQQERLATLDGPGRAVKTLPADSPGQPQKQLSSSWSRSATLFFTGQPNEPLRIETAKLAGSVSVQHPQLSLTADALKLDFDPAPTTRPTTLASSAATDDKNTPPDFSASDLRHLDAQGHVHATVLSSNNRPQSIVADHLELDTASTPDGRIYPKTLTADGSVVASDPDQELRANHIKTSLLPAAASPNTPQATRNKQSPESVPVELQHLTATDAVSVHTSDGVTVSAARLDVDVDPATRAQQVRLLGSPAHVSSKENSVTGPYIEILPADQAYHVRGPGRMHLLQRETPQSKPRPVDVAWTQSVSVDGKQNLIDVLGNVSVTSADETGTGDHLRITLADNPNAATRPASRKSPSTRKLTPLTGIASTGDPMQDKTVQTVSFLKGAALQSVQVDKQTNSLLRQMNLNADVVNYDFPHKRVTVPVPGQMLFVNRQQQQGGSDTATSPAAAANARGNTAFSWSRQMTFDQSANVMTMTGDVAIAHEADADDKPFRLDADKVTATLAPKTSTTQQATGNGQLATDAVDLKHVTAEGTIRFTSKDTQLTASTVDYDPATGILVARGQGRDPVRLFDPDGVQLLTATEVTFDTKTGQNLHMTDVQAQTRRRNP